MPITRCLALAFQILPLLLLTSSLVAQPIYKVRDADGNIVYTDQKPSEDASPLELPELGIMEEDGPALLGTLAPEPAPEANLDPNIEPLDLVILHPQDGMQFSLADGAGLPVELDSNIELPPSAQIVLFINDQPQEPIRQMAIILAGLEAGNYRLRAELQSPSGRLLARTDELIFSVRAAPEIRPSP